MLFIRLSALLVCLFWPMLSWGGVTFDSAFEKGFTTGSAKPRSFASNAGTVAGTVNSNPNRGLVCAVALNAAGLIPVLTWSGVTMTDIIGGGLVWNGGIDEIHLFGLIAPATGNQTISLSWTGASTAFQSYIGCMSVYNMDQVTGWQNSGSDTGTGTASSSTVTTAIGNMAVVGHGNNNASSTTINAGSSAWIDTTGATNAAEGYLASVSGSSVVSWTLGSSVAWGNIKVDLIGSSTCSIMLTGVGTC